MARVETCHSLNLWKEHGGTRVKKELDYSFGKWEWEGNTLKALTYWLISKNKLSRWHGSGEKPCCKLNVNEMVIHKTILRWNIARDKQRERLKEWELWEQTLSDWQRAETRRRGTPVKDRLWSCYERAIGHCNHDDQDMIRIDETWWEVEFNDDILLANSTLDKGHIKIRL